MAPPTFLGSGTVAAGTAAITPALPTGFTFQTDDLIIGVGETAGGAVFPLASITTNGWAHVNGISPVTQDSQTTLTVIWRRWTAGLTAHSWGDSGNHNIGRYVAFRGVKNTGNPWNQVAGGIESVANTSAEWPIPPATTVADCLVLLCIATGRDPTAAITNNLGAPSGGNLTSMVERIDNWTEMGTGGGIGLIEGVLSTATTFSTPTATMGSTDTKAYLTLALEPAGAGPTAITLTDSGAAADSLSVAAAVPLPHSSTAADSLLGLATVSLADAAAAADSMDVLLPPVEVTLTDTGLAGEHLCHTGGPDGAPDCILHSENLTGPLPYLWDDPVSPDANWLTATDPAAPIDLRVSFPTPGTAPGSGGPTVFQVPVRKVGTGADPVIRVELWEAGVVVKTLTEVTITSPTGQLVTATLIPADLTDASGAQVELRIRMLTEGFWGGYEPGYG